MNKRWWESKTVWAGVCTFVIGMANLFRVGVPADVTPEWGAEQIADIATGLGVALAGLIAIWGRVKATKFIR